MQGLFSMVGLLLVGDTKILPHGLALFSFVAFIGVNMLFYMIFTGMKRRQRMIEKLAARKKRNS